MSEYNSPESSEISENCLQNLSEVYSSYTLYIFSTNKHATSPESNFDIPEKQDSKSSDSEDSSICLSLLEGNLSAEHETVVRCYLLKTLPLKDDFSFENEGKCAPLKLSDDLVESHGCYYRRLLKNISDTDKSDSSDCDSVVTKTCTFFICLIGPGNGIMELFCPELSAFCDSLLPLLDPEGISNQQDVQQMLKNWYSYCIEYITRCIKTFGDSLVTVFHTSLWGNTTVVCEDENVKWDLERLIETTTLLPKTDIKSASPIQIKVIGDKIEVDKPFVPSEYCQRWFKQLSSCHIDDHAGLRNILEGFRLKAIQDLNMLKRLIQRAENDHYALYRALLFLQSSGYDELLLQHVEREARIAKSEEALDVIECLRDYMHQKNAISA